MKNHDTLYGVLDNIGAVLGPILGIVMADFFIVRRRLAVRDLYQPDGIYRASGGYNLVASASSSRSPLSSSSASTPRPSESRTCAEV
jgi:cytosine/uracil/thiamine/allantoin permease